MTDEQGGEAAVVENAQAAPEAAVSSQAERDYAAEAREMGWVPEEEWKGDKRPSKFLTAEEFVERGETLIPILNKRIKAKDEETAKRIERLEKSFERTLDQVKKQHAKEVEGLTAQRREAIKAGDVNAVEALDRQIDDLREAGPDKPQTDEEVQSEWMKANQWFDDDEDMRVAAIGYSNAIRRDDLSMAENLKRVDAYMRKKFPDKFGGTKETKAANGHAAVDSGGTLSGVIPHKETTFSKLPSEAKRQFERDVSEGLYKDTAADRETWAKAFYN